MEETQSKANKLKSQKSVLQRDKDIQNESWKWEKKGEEARDDKRWYEALNCFHIAMNLLNIIDPGDTYIWLALADSFAMIEHNSSAIDCAERVLELDPNNAQAYFLLGDIHSKMRIYSRQEEAKRMFDRALEVEPKLQKRIDRIYKMTPKPVCESPVGVIAEGEYDTLVSHFLQLMERSWGMNDWWYKPRSTSNPRPTFIEQFTHLVNTYEKSVANWAEKMKTKTAKASNAVAYHSVGFSKDIHILRGISIFSHPNIGRDINSYLDFCKAYDCVPDVLLWAPDIKIHMVIALYEDTGRLRGCQDVTIHIVSGYMPSVKEEKRLRKELLTRAWREALRIGIMNPLVLILFPVLKNCYAKKEKMMTKGRVIYEQFIEMCQKMKTTNFRSFFYAAFHLAQIYEAIGEKNRAKEMYLLALKTKFPIKYSFDEVLHSDAEYEAHVRVGVLHKENGEFDKAWDYYQKAATFSHLFDKNAHRDMLIANIGLLFIENSWRPFMWRNTKAAYFLYNYIRITGGLDGWSEAVPDGEFWKSVFERVQISYDAGPITHVPQKDYVSGAMKTLVQKGDLYSECVRCKVVPERRLLCSRCKRRIYCSKKCQIEDWPKHKQECRRFTAREEELKNKK